MGPRLPKGPIDETKKKEEQTEKFEPKFDKQKCLKCKYRGTSTHAGYVIHPKRKGGRNETVFLHCNYSGITGKTCLRRGPHGTSFDIRGKRGEDCKLFEEGDKLPTPEDHFNF